MSEPAIVIFKGSAGKVGKWDGDYFVSGDAASVCMELAEKVERLQAIIDAHFDWEDVPLENADPQQIVTAVGYETRLKPVPGDLPEWNLWGALPYDTRLRSFMAHPGSYEVRRRVPKKPQ